MLFTEGSLKFFRITKNKYFYNITNRHTYYYHYACNECGYPFLHSNKNGKYCTLECMNTSNNNPSKRPEVKEKLSGINSPTKRPEVRNKISKTMKALGEFHHAKKPEVRNKMSIARMGENNPAWKGGISCEPYCIQWTDKEYKDWLKYERDGGKCNNPQCNGKSHRLCLHHINYNKKDCRPINLITLCNSCNSIANKDREWHEAYYTTLMVLYN